MVNYLMGHGLGPSDCGRGRGHGCSHGHRRVTPSPLYSGDITDPLLQAKVDTIYGLSYVVWFVLDKEEGSVILEPFLRRRIGS